MPTETVTIFFIKVVHHSHQASLSSPLFLLKVLIKIYIKFLVISDTFLKILNMKNSII